MKFNHIMIAAALVLGTSSVARASTITGPYVAGGAGADITQTQHYHSYEGTKGRFGHNTGMTGFGSAGWGFGNGLRAEVEGDYFHSSVNRDTGASPHRARGGDENYGVMVNVLYDIDLKKHWNIDVPVTPFVGVGAGYMWDSLKVKSAANSTYGTQGSFAYQGIVGARYKIPDVNGLYLTTEYRMVGQTMSGDHFRSTSDMADHMDHKFNHQFIVGVLYNFGDKGPTPVETPAPMPIAAPSRSYIVFFNWDDYNLTDVSRDIIERAAESSRKINVTSIQVNGYADTSKIHMTSGKKYNMNLSIKRALSVKEELIKDGVDKNSILIKGYGDNVEFIKTSDNAREPFNRRVEIILN